MISRSDLVLNSRPSSHTEVSDNKGLEIRPCTKVLKYSAYD